MNEAQKLVLGRFGKHWVVDYNFQNEPIVYVLSEDRKTVNEYVVDKEGKPTKTAEYPYTVKLQKELKLNGVK